MKHSRELDVREKSHALMLAVHRDTVDFPSDELHGITGQLRRTSVLMGMNISDAFRSASVEEFTNRLETGLRLIGELESELQQSCVLGYLGLSRFDELRGGVSETKRALKEILADLSLQCDFLEQAIPTVFIAGH